MIRRTLLCRALALSAAMLAGGAARAAEIRVVSSGGFAAACRALAPDMEPLGTGRRGPADAGRRGQAASA
ncbi:hypothetical protein [Methylobacterium sp. WSM2598]|uniref:hypothetical protein n=1 Tax=Methylobacterium sp. WSM2598 TaxID=398261 RepID=UPI00036C4318|nr:hypothetical protein [Methylobacterium sp. WSM2598]